MTSHIDHATASTLRPFRLMVSGGSVLSHKAAILWSAVGSSLAKTENIVIVSGGMKQRKVGRGRIAADWAMVKGFHDALVNRSQESTKIETILPGRETKKDLFRFSLGRVVEITDRSPRSRRFTMVNSSDMVVSIEGSAGTREVIDLALALNKPVLPVPFGDKTKVSAKYWDQEEYAEVYMSILDTFGIETADADRWLSVDIDTLTTNELELLGQEIASTLRKGFKTKCFVMMPFGDNMNDVYDNGIHPAIKASDMKPVRLDRLALTGNAVESLRSALRYCDIAIADISSLNPNVMYELGIAHAEGKPVIILCEEATEVNRDALIPFDLRTEFVIFYNRPMKQLEQDLIKALQPFRRIRPSTMDIE